ncbi:MAG: hypothetical protein R3B48_19090 [Kofleriaceae bacterium]
MSDARAPATGTVHDLGYKRYLGGRLAQGLRWRVVMRQQLTFAWKTWWRYKVSLIGAIIATLVAGAVMYAASDTVVSMISRSPGSMEAGLASTLAVRFIDGILPLSVLWYCKIGFVASLTIAASVVATDLRTGAFSFYFARSVRPVDYVAGKLGGLLLLAALLLLAGPLLLALLRVGLSDSTRQVIDQLKNLHRAAIVGGVGAVVYSVIPLGFSALVADRRWAVGLWALYYTAFGSMMSGLGLVLWSPLGALDLPVALSRISFTLFDVTMPGSRGASFPVTWAYGSIAVHAAVALALVTWRVRRAALDGVGGAS